MSLPFLQNQLSESVQSHSVIRSKLFSQLFEHYDGNRRLTVLDVGPGTAETVNFFSRRQCRLCFADLISEPIVYSENEIADEKIILEKFKALLSFPPDTRFDICLFWDFLNYLDITKLKAFSQALQPFIQKHTLGHGFGVYNTKAKPSHQRFSVKEVDELLASQRSEQALPFHPHQQAELQRQFHGFTIKKGTLLSDGRLEFLFHAT